MHDKSLLQENKCIFVTKVKLSEFYFGLILKRSWSAFMNTTERYSINPSVMAARFLTHLPCTRSIKLQNDRIIIFLPIKISTMRFNNMKSFICPFMHAYCSHWQQWELRNQLGDENSLLNTSLNYLRQVTDRLTSQILIFHYESLAMLRWDMPFSFFFC